ncbi:hypothetical protein E4T38_05006 [Aureobasidium subglaciale]|nr:hypothetical protein E4T38_05006 [Aureobasidium subglaciale]KAI5222252.1 hypothetical protein E4T40_05044 [Aureobasidium subglaciale]KAI5226364.1 hypothetical protein E4T41_04863 [Aureobasidium subglaciale]KAI5262038.1 hypothetical protein E4T46_04756 [Aureobasidium subglaciale]
MEETPSSDIGRGRYQTLREHTNALSKPIPPQFVGVAEQEPVRAKDLDIHNDKSWRETPLSSTLRDQELERPEHLAKKAKVKEYIFTGSREKDTRALHEYIAACDRAIHALDANNRDARTLERLKLRMDMTILKESLKEELEKRLTKMAITALTTGQ